MHPPITSGSFLKEPADSKSCRGTAMQKIIFEYISGLVFSVFGFFALAGLHTLFEMVGFELAWGGDKGKVFWGMFFGLPGGSILGFLVVDKLYFKIDTWYFQGMLMAFIVGVIANVVALYLIDRLGGGFLLAIPPLVSLACVWAYNIGR
jgi:hypothetical protein